MSEPEWTIELLGGFRASRGALAGRPLSHKSATLLAWLALNHQTAHSRDELATLLWPEATPSASRHSLRTALYDIRKLLEPAGAPSGSVLVADREFVRLVPDAFTTDVAEFLRAASDAAACLAADRIGALDRALAWYRGELLPGHFDEWVLAARRRLADLYADLLARLFAEHATAGNSAAAVDVAHRLIACDPFNEDAQLGLMRLYADDGRIGPALELYRAFARLLEDELGVEPSEAMQALARSLHLKLRASSGETSRARLPAESRLPAPLTQFYGRETELDYLAALLLTGSARLVTIAGAGGIGKTRLAAEFARRARADHGVTVTYVELADVVDATFVADSIAAATGLGKLATHDPLDSVTAVLDVQSHPIVIIDNAERVAPAVAAASKHLLANVPALRVLVTTRQALNVAGETEVRLGPLPTPADWELPEDLGRNPSVAMYVDRVRAKRADFKLTDANAAAVARLCTRLEGIPLAIELAAVRERVLPASQLIGLLERRFEVLVGAQRDVPDRHRTLSAAIDWSYHALDAESRVAFSRLAVFRGGWTLAHAESVCAADSIDAMLDRMCDVSLVEPYDRAGTRRFRMLETIREFAIERIPDGVLDELRGAHARLMLELAERASTELSRHEQAQWLEQLDADMDNVRSALDWSLRAGDVETVVRTVVALNRYWMARSRLREARRWLRDALAAGGELLDRMLVRRGLRFAGELALADGDLDDAEKCLERAAALGAGDEDARTTGYIQSGLGHIAARHGRFDAARELLLGGREIAMTTGDVELLACIANDLGVLGARTGDLTGALDRFQESLSAYRSLGDDTSVVVLLYNLGYLATIARQFDRAETFLRESLQLSRQLGHVAGIATATTFTGLLELARGQFETAVTRCAEAVELCLEIGEVQRLALAIEGLGCAFEALRADGLSARLIGHAGALRRELETEALFEDPGVVAGVVARITARLGETDAERALAAGRDASTEKVLGWVRERE